MREWRGRQKKGKKKSICLTLCSAATIGCVQVSHYVCMCPNSRGATKWSNLFPRSFGETRLMCNGREEGTHHRERQRESERDG